MVLDFKVSLVGLRRFVFGMWINFLQAKKRNTTKAKVISFKWDVFFLLFGNEKKMQVKKLNLNKINDKKRQKLYQ